jgi:hypothetical protein
LISFKGAQHPKSVILYAVYFYVRFPVSYRDLAEIMAERGVDLDHATLNRWVEKYAGTIAAEAHRRRAPTGCSWRMDETYVKVKSKRYQVFLSKCHGMSSSMRALGWPAVMASSVALERVALNRFQSWLWLAAHNATTAMHVATRM